MADDPVSLHIDTDWKKQAQEEKKRLADAEAQRASAQAAPTASSAATGQAAPRPAGARQARELPPASFATIVQSTMTQALFYLGELGSQGGESNINLDMAKHQIDTLGVLEAKTKGNLSADEQRLLDAALYETRMRYVSVASQYL